MNHPPTNFRTTQPDLFQAAFTLNQAQKNLTRLWDKFYDTIQPLELNRFWQLLPLLNQEIDTYRFNYKRTDGVEDATSEMYRKTLTGSNQSILTPYTFDEMLQFSVRYGNIKRQLDKQLGPLFEFCGDSFGDLMDTLPLLGETFITPILEHDRGLVLHRFNHNETGLYASIKNHLKETYPDETLYKQWYKLIGGENYIAMHLEEQGKKYLCSFVRDELTEEECQLCEY